MSSKRRNKQRKSDSEKILFLFGDIFIGCFYRTAKILWAKIPIKESFKENKGAFIYDSLTSLFVLGLLIWSGFWHFFSHQLFICWEIAGGIIALMGLAYGIGRFRRRNLDKDDAEIEEKVEEKSQKLPTKTLETEFTDSDLEKALRGLNFTTREAKMATNYVKTNYPDKPFEEKLKFALQFAGQENA